MSDDYEVTVGLSTADLVGSCPRCNEPSTGRYDHDEGEAVLLKCVNCGFRLRIRISDNLLSFPAEDIE